MSQPIAASAIAAVNEALPSASLQEVAGNPAPPASSGFDALLFALGAPALASRQPVSAPEAERIDLPAADPEPLEAPLPDTPPEFVEFPAELDADAPTARATERPEPELALPPSLLQLVLGTSRAPQHDSPPVSAPPMPAPGEATGGEAPASSPRPTAEPRNAAPVQPAPPAEPAPSAHEPVPASDDFPAPRELAQARADTAAREGEPLRAEPETPRRSPPEETRSESAAARTAPPLEPGSRDAAAQEEPGTRQPPADPRSATGQVGTSAAARTDAAGHANARTEGEAAPQVARLLPELPARNEVEVVRSVRVLAGQGGGQVQIRLDPPELGGVSVRVAMSDGALQVTLIADHAPVADLFGRHSSELRHALESQGLRLDQLEVGAGSADPERGSAQPRDPDAREAAMRASHRSVSEPVLSFGPRRLDVTTLGAVDVHV